MGRPHAPPPCSVPVDYTAISTITVSVTGTNTQMAVAGVTGPGSGSGSCGIVFTRVPQSTTPGINQFTATIECCSQPSIGAPLGGPNYLTTGSWSDSNSAPNSCSGTVAPLGLNFTITDTGTGWQIVAGIANISPCLNHGGSNALLAGGIINFAYTALIGTHVLNFSNTSLGGDYNCSGTLKVVIA